LAISYYRSFNLPVKIVRPFNTFGPRQSARAIIPTIITQILSGKRKINLGNLNPTRDLTFVKDTCKGFIEIYKCDKLFGEITNIGMKEEITIGDLVNKIAKLLNTPIEIETEEQRVRPENSEVERLLCDNTKLIANTNWNPDYNLEKGLVETIDWLEKNINLYKTDIYNV
jgi:dTDP-glucose 4,6-dehydratase